MVASHRSIIAGAVLLVAGATGASADYYGGMKDVPVTVMQPASWYVRGDASYSWMDAGELSGAITPFGSLSIDNTWAVGGGVGHYFGRGFRGDVTYEYRCKTDVHGDGACGVGSTITGDFARKQLAAARQPYYDFRPYERFTPYVGIGVGAAHHSTSSGAYTTCGLRCCDHQLQRRQRMDGGRRPDGRLQLPHRSRWSRPRQHQGRPRVRRARPPATSMSATASSTWATRTPAASRSAPVAVTPGPRLEDVTAQEIRVGLRWDIR